MHNGAPLEPAGEGKESDPALYGLVLEAGMGIPEM